MRDEIGAAVHFLIRLIDKNDHLRPGQIECFQSRLSLLLTERFRNHWFPEQPFKGQGYRCIRLNECDRREPLIEQAATDSGLRYEDLRLPIELTIWVDPAEVCCRFGEHRGSYCTVASFKGDRASVNIDDIDVDALELKSKQRAKQASIDFVLSRKSSRFKNGLHSSSTTNETFSQNGSNGAHNGRSIWGSNGHSANGSTNAMGLMTQSNGVFYQPKGLGNLSGQFSPPQLHRSHVHKLNGNRYTTQNRVSAYNGNYPPVPPPLPPSTSHPLANISNVKIASNDRYRWAPKSALASKT